MVDKDFLKSLESVADSLLEVAKAEREKKDSYKDLFSSSDSNDITGLLRKAELQMSEVALDVSHILQEKYGIKVSNDKFWILMALPYACEILERELRKEEGYACCVDKAFYLLDKYLLDK